jgi:hypothetical protein
LFEEIAMPKVLETFGAWLMRLALISTVFAIVSWSQGTPPMRTRYLTSLTNTEIETYLKRSDLIFIPVGNVEVHGGFPTDCEYVGPLAFAQKMAEETDGLVFPYLAYFFPGGTVVGKGTVYAVRGVGLSEGAGAITTSPRIPAADLPDWARTIASNTQPIGT